MEVYLNIILDVAVAALLIIFAVRGANKGFVMTIAGIVVLILAVVGAGLCAKVLTQPVAKLIEPSIRETLAAKTWDGLEDSLDSIGEIKLFGVTVAETDAYGTVTEAAHDTVEQTTAALAAQLSSSIAYCIVTVASFILLMLILYLVMRLLDLTFKLPVLSTFNKLMGLLAGTVKGVIIVLLLVSVAGFFTGIIPTSVQENTVLFSFFMRLNPLAL